MIQRIVEKKKQTVIETNEGGEATGTGSANRGLQCIFLNREGCCCFDTTENGGIPDRDSYLCWFCADLSAGCVQPVMQLVLFNCSPQPIHHFRIQLSSTLINMLSLCQ